MSEKFKKKIIIKKSHASSQNVHDSKNASPPFRSPEREKDALGYTRNIEQIA